MFNLLDSVEKIFKPQVHHTPPFPISKISIVKTQYYQHIVLILLNFIVVYITIKKAVKMEVFIIRQKQIPLSKKLSIEAAESCDKFKLNYTFFEGIGKSEVEGWFKGKGLFKASDFKSEFGLGTMGCFASHFSLWEKTIELNEPLLIMEHDGLMTNDPTVLLDKFDDVCHLDPYPLFNPMDPKHFKKYQRHCLYNYRTDVENIPYSKFYGCEPDGVYCFKGAHGYLIKPEGAKKLIKFIKENGSYPADRAICNSAVELIRSKTTFVRMNPFFNKIETHRLYSTRK